MPGFICNDTSLFVTKDKAAWLALLSLVAYTVAFFLPVFASESGFVAFYVGFVSLFDDWHPAWLANPLYWLSLYLVTRRPACAAAIELLAVAFASTPLFLLSIQELEHLRAGYFVWLLSFYLHLSACGILLSKPFRAWLESHHLWSKKHNTLALLLLIGMVAFVAVTAHISEERLRYRREAVAAIEAIQGQVTYRPYVAHPVSRVQWLASRIYGADVLQHVVSINMGRPEARLGDSELRHLEYFEQLEKLSIGNADVSAAGAASLAGLSHLTSVTIRDSAVEPGSLRVLNGLPSLHELTLSHVDVSKHHLHEIASLKGVRVRLNLTSSTFSSGEMSALTHAENIHSLHFHNMNVSDKAWMTLGRMRGLSRLSFDDVELSGEAFAAIHRQDTLFDLSFRKVRTSEHAWTQLEMNNELQRLFFARMELRKDAFAAIQRQRQLRVLGMHGVRAAADAWDELTFMPELEEVLLNDMFVSDTALKAIGRQARVHYLNMNDSTFANDSFAQVFRLKNLKTLALHRTDVTAADLRQINKVSQLTRLELHATKVSDQLCDSLRHLKNLKILNLTITFMTPQAVERLRKELTNCKVQY